MCNIILEKISFFKKSLKFAHKDVSCNQRNLFTILEWILFDLIAQMLSAICR